MKNNIEDLTKLDLSFEIKVYHEDGIHYDEFKKSMVITNKDLSLNGMYQLRRWYRKFLNRANNISKEGTGAFLANYLAIASQDVTPEIKPFVEEYVKASIQGFGIIGKEDKEN